MRYRRWARLAGDTMLGMMKRVSAFAIGPNLPQLAGLAAVVWGVALVSEPAALILGGLGAILFGQGLGKGRR